MTPANRPLWDNEQQREHAEAIVRHNPRWAWPKAEGAKHATVESPTHYIARVAVLAGLVDEPQSGPDYDCGKRGCVSCAQQHVAVTPDSITSPIPPYEPSPATRWEP